jgi:hypothetical protein
VRDTLPYVPPRRYSRRLNGRRPLPHGLGLIHQLDRFIEKVKLFGRHVSGKDSKSADSHSDEYWSAHLRAQIAERPDIQQYLAKEEEGNIL